MPCLCAPSHVSCCAEKCQALPPQTHTFLKRRFHADFKKYTHPPPPPVTTCLHAEAKVAETTEKCQNPQSWKVMNVPERNAFVTKFLNLVKTIKTILLSLTINLMGGG